MTGNRRPSFDPAQLGFTFDPPALARAEAALAGLERQVSAAVGLILKQDSRSRAEIAGSMSALMAEPISPKMLDAYASEARDHHNISFARFLALIAATDRHDVLDAHVARIGAKLLVGEEVHAAHLGHLKAQASELARRIKQLERITKPIIRGGRG